MASTYESPGAGGSARGALNLHSGRGEHSENNRTVADGQERVIAAITRGLRTELRVQFRTFRPNRRMVDVRLFAVDGRGVMIPTAKGITCKPDMLHELIEALTAAQREIAAGRFE